jgi:hypothetical protein
MAYTLGIIAEYLHFFPDENNALDKGKKLQLPSF